MTDERWLHITTGHPEVAAYYYELLEAIESPEVIFEGGFGERIAVMAIREHPPKYIVVVYREIDQTDGFVITAYLSDRNQSTINRKKLWEQH